MCAQSNVMIVYKDKTIVAEKGTLLSQCLNMEMPCGGHGNCGKCKIRVEGALSEVSKQEKKLLSQEEISDSVRLACCTYVLGDCKVEAVSDASHTQIVTEGMMPDFRLQPIFRRYGVALDIGTTTLAARLYNLAGQLLSTACADNPQSVYGSDVIGRIERSLEGCQKELAECVCKTIDEMLYQMAKDANIACNEIDGMVITGNTTMLYFLTCRLAKSLSCAPFAADHLFGETYTAQNLGIKSILPQTQIYIPPCISAFVGADMVCAILSSQICDEKKSALLVDIGTNGEMALWDGGKLTVCSTAAGPAFEGSVISMGMKGASGAVDSVTWNGSQMQLHVIGGLDATGICGSGLIDAVCCMLRAGVLEDSGYLEQNPYYLNAKISINRRDVRMLQMAKSAICAGICVLIQKLADGELPKMYIAGGFGKYLNLDSAVQIGLFPTCLREKTQVIGNGALSGAAMMLLNDSYGAIAQEIALKAEVLELSTNIEFSELFTQKMIFSPTLF